MPWHVLETRPDLRGTTRIEIAPSVKGDETTPKGRSNDGVGGLAGTEREGGRERGKEGSKGADQKPDCRCTRGREGGKGRKDKKK